jgi:glutamyl-tRNA reductase
MLFVGQGPCVLRVGVIGINFKTADLSLRESLARSAQKLSGERGIFFRHPTVILSTCNRTEIYFSGEELAEAHSDLLAWLRGQIEEPFEHRLYSYFGIDCFAHLCKVSAGLDSAILAETEIQRQVKVAYQRSSEIYVLPGAIHYLFQKALKVSKGIRCRLEVEGEGPSLFAAIWEMIEGSGLHALSSRILLVGYSEINRGLASFLLHKGVKRFSLCTRNPQTVHLEGAIALDRTALKDWAQFDLIVCASRSNEFLIEGTSSKKHLIFDLSVPRNVDPRVGESPLVQLYHLEQIKVKRSLSERCLEECNGWIWQQVTQLARIYRQKNERAQSFSFI